MEKSPSSIQKKLLPKIVFTHPSHQHTLPHPTTRNEEEELTATAVPGKKNIVTQAITFIVAESSSMIPFASTPRLLSCWATM